MIAYFYILANGIRQKAFTLLIGERLGAVYVKGRIDFRHNKKKGADISKQVKVDNLNDMYLYINKVIIAILTQC
jgi:hypothetical protein